MASLDDLVTVGNSVNKNISQLILAINNFASLYNSVIAVANGGTGNSSLTANAVLTGNGTNPIVPEPFFVCDNSGNVGIGTASPSQKLEVSGGVIKCTQGVTGYPAFKVYLSANQTGVPTDGSYYVVNFDAVEFDTNSCFNTSTYKFTPNVAGYYQINFNLDVKDSNSVTGDIKQIWATVEKNGNTVSSSTYSDIFIGVEVILVGSDIVYMNGSTDYLQITCTASATSGTMIFATNGSYYSYFSGCLIRAA